MTLSSDSDSPPEDSPLREDKDADSPFNETSKAKSPRKRLKAEHPKSTKKQKVNNHKKKEGITGGQYRNFMFFYYSIQLKDIDSDNVILLLIRLHSKCSLKVMQGMKVARRLQWKNHLMGSLM